MTSGSSHSASGCGTGKVERVQRRRAADIRDRPHAPTAAAARTACGAGHIRRTRRGSGRSGSTGPTGIWSARTGPGSLRHSPPATRPSASSSSSCSLIDASCTPAGRWRGGGPRPARRRAAACGSRHRRAPARHPRTRRPPPNAWIASSMIFSAMIGAATLIIAISPCAALLPARSIMSAALRHSRRVISMSMRALAIRSSHTPCSAMRLAERDARHQPLHHRLERFLGGADRAHAMVDAARPEPPLRDLEAPALAEQHVRRRHAHVVELDLHVPVRRVVIAEHRQVPLDRDARRIERHQDHRLLLVASRADGSVLPIRIATLQRGSPAPLDHHLRPLIDIFVAAHFDAALDVGRVGRGDVGLGHQEGRADLAVHQRLQPLVLLLARAVAVQHLHVAGVRRGAVEHLRRPQRCGPSPRRRRHIGGWRAPARRTRSCRRPAPRRATAA